MSGSDATAAPTAQARENESRGGMPQRTRLVLQQAHRQLKDAAEVSKRSLAAHKRALREQKRGLEDIERTCAELGIDLEIDTGQGPQGGRRQDGQHT